MAPLSQDGLRRGVVLLILHASAFNLPTDDKALFALYGDALRDVPDDLFLAAIRAILADWSNDYGRLPPPAIVRAKIAEDIRVRRITLQRLTQQRAQPDPLPEEKPMTPAELTRCISQIDTMPEGALKTALRQFAATVAERQKSRTLAEQHAQS